MLWTAKQCDERSLYNYIFFNEIIALHNYSARIDNAVDFVCSDPYNNAQQTYKCTSYSAVKNADYQICE